MRGLCGGSSSLQCIPHMFTSCVVSILSVFGVVCEMWILNKVDRTLPCEVTLSFSHFIYAQSLLHILLTVHSSLLVQCFG